MITSQTVFANHIKNSKYQRCIITNATTGLDAAHIIDKAICEKNNNKYLKFHISNGISLRKDIHQAFDNHIWCFNPFDCIDNTDNKTISIGIIYDMSKNIPEELTKQKYYIVDKNDYYLIYIRYVEFSYKYAERHKNNLPSDSYDKINSLYESVFSKIAYITKLENNYAYEYDGDLLMINWENVSQFYQYQKDESNTTNTINTTNTRNKN